jgi:predicted amidohydrolase
MAPAGVTVAVCQTPEILGDPDAAVAYMESAAVSAPGADVMLFPEGFLQGYLATPSHVAATAMDLGSAAFDTVLRRLAGLEPTLVFGVLERAGSHLYNSAAIVARGRLQGVYRKTHLYGSELGCFTAGTEYPVFSRGSLTFGVNICYDTRFPEAAAAVARQGAQAILVPSQNMMPVLRAQDWKDRHNEIRRLRVLETGLWLASADVCGQRGPDRIGLGPTSIMDPTATVVAQVPLGTPGAVTAQIPASSSFS